MSIDAQALDALLAKADEALDAYLVFAAKHCSSRTAEAAAPIVNALRANVERLHAVTEEVAPTFVNDVAVHKLAGALHEDPAVDLDVAKQLVQLARAASGALFEAFEVVRRSESAGANDHARAVVRPYLHVAGTIFSDLDRPVASKFPELAVS
jgi:hypothetical protein